MFIEIHPASFTEIILTSVSLLFVFGHNLWLIAKKDSQKFRLEINTSDVFPESDSAVKPERVKDFRIVSANNSAPVENFRVEENSLVADVESAESFYAALELYAHPITLEAEKFAGYIAHEDAQRFIEPSFAAGVTTAPQRESYAKYAKVFCEVNQSGDAFNLTVGHRFEIVPQTDLRVGEMIVQVLFDEKPIANLRVSVGGENINGGKYLAHTRTDENGLAAIEIERGGHWFLRTHYIRPQSNLVFNEWESFWASLSFRLE